MAVGNWMRHGPNGAVVWPPGSTQDRRPGGPQCGHLPEPAHYPGGARSGTRGEVPRPAGPKLHPDPQVSEFVRGPFFHFAGSFERRVCCVTRVPGMRLHLACLASNPGHLTKAVPKLQPTTSEKLEGRAVGFRDPENWSKKCRRNSRANASVAVVTTSQLLTAKASMDCRAGERLAVEQASATSTAAAAIPQGSWAATT